MLEAKRPTCRIKKRLVLDTKNIKIRLVNKIKKINVKIIYFYLFKFSDLLHQKQYLEFL